MTDAIATFQSEPQVVKLVGVPKHYAWGGFEFLRTLAGLSGPDNQPCAELWLGNHPAGPATAWLGDIPVPLPELVRRAPDVALGPAIAARFAGQFPYLFKVLDARQMLSIQAHPTRQQAAEGFAREEANGLALNADTRSYKDRNHKPEVHVALTDFWLLHGFRPLEEIAATLAAVREFAALMPDFGDRLDQAGQDEAARRELLRTLYRSIMTMPEVRVDQILNPLIARLQQQASGAADTQDKSSPAYWVLRAAEDFPPRDGHRDRGMFSIYLLNLIHLQPGQATFQPAGTLHAYLAGVNVELMANSDNVLRGGLTNKCVNVDELLNVVRFTAGRPAVMTGERISATETVYATSAEEFELSRLQLAAGQACRREPDHGPVILLLLDGAAVVRSGHQALALRRGEAVLAPHPVGYAVEALGGSATLFKAAVPAR